MRIATADLAAVACLLLWLLPGRAGASLSVELSGGWRLRPSGTVAIEADPGDRAPHTPHNLPCGMFIGDVAAELHFDRDPGATPSVLFLTDPGGVTDSQCGFGGDRPHPPARLALEGRFERTVDGVVWRGRAGTDRVRREAWDRLAAGILRLEVGLPRKARPVRIGRAVIRIGYRQVPEYPVFESWHGSLPGEPFSFWWGWQDGLFLDRWPPEDVEPRIAKVRGTARFLWDLPLPGTPPWTTRPDDFLFVPPRMHLDLFLSDWPSGGALRRTGVQIGRGTRDDGIVHELGHVLRNRAYGPSAVTGWYNEGMAIWTGTMVAGARRPVGWADIALSLDEGSPYHHAGLFEYLARASARFDRASADRSIHRYCPAERFCLEPREGYALMRRAMELGGGGWRAALEGAWAGVAGEPVPFEELFARYAGWNLAPDGAAPEGFGGISLQTGDGGWCGAPRTGSDPVVYRGGFRLPAAMPVTIWIRARLDFRFYGRTDRLSLLIDGRPVGQAGPEPIRTVIRHLLFGPTTNLPAGRHQLEIRVSGAPELLALAVLPGRVERLQPAWDGTAELRLDLPEGRPGPARLWLTGRLDPGERVSVSGPGVGARAGLLRLDGGLHAGRTRTLLVEPGAGPVSVTGAIARLDDLLAVTIDGPPLLEEEWGCLPGHAAAYRRVDPGGSAQVRPIGPGDLRSRIVTAGGVRFVSLTTGPAPVHYGLTLKRDGTSDNR